MQTKPADFFNRLFKFPGISVCLNMELKHNLLVHQAINSLVANIHFKMGVENYWNSYYYANRWWSNNAIKVDSDQPQQTLGYFYENRPHNPLVDFKNEAIMLKADDPSDDDYNDIDNPRQRLLDKQVGINSLLYWSNNYNTFISSYLSSNSPYLESFYNPEIRFVVNKLQGMLANHYFVNVPQKNRAFSDLCQYRVKQILEPEISQETKEAREQQRKQQKLKGKFIYSSVESIILALDKQSQKNLFEPDFAQALLNLIKAYATFSEKKVFYNVRQEDLNAKAQEYFDKHQVDLYSFSEYIPAPVEFIQAEQYQSYAPITLDTPSLLFSDYFNAVEFIFRVGAKALLSQGQNKYPALKELQLNTFETNTGVFKIINFLPIFGYETNYFADNKVRLNFTHFVPYERDLINALAKEQAILDEVQFYEQEYRQAYLSELDLSVPQASKYTDLMANTLASYLIDYYLAFTPGLSFLYKKFAAIDNRREVYSNKSYGVSRDIELELPEFKVQSYESYLAKAKEGQESKTSPSSYNFNLDDLNFLRNFANPGQSIVDTFKKAGIDYTNISSVPANFVLESISNLEEKIAQVLEHTSYYDTFVRPQSTPAKYLAITCLTKLAPEATQIIAPLGQQDYLVKKLPKFTRRDYAFIRDAQNIILEGQVKSRQPTLINKVPVSFLTRKANISALSTVADLSVQALDLFLNQRRYAKYEDPSDPLPNVVFIEDVVSFLLHSMPKVDYHYDFNFLRQFYTALIAQNRYSENPFELIKLVACEYQEKLDNFYEQLNKVYDHLLSLVNEFNIHVVMNFNLTSVAQAFGLKPGELWHKLKDNKFIFLQFSYSHDSYLDLPEDTDEQILEKEFFKEVSPDFTIEQDPQLYLTSLQNTNDEFTVSCLSELFEEDFSKLLRVQGTLKITINSQLSSLLAGLKFEEKEMYLKYAPFSRQIQFS
ncbi:hypothetical protein CJP74_06320 [Psittacicella melopsittaci]|uniref:Uncharacterized protein n=1 Tax=Psittacicella melopsittaci TaxID=2028576 RepID=A0A3A1Y0L1_9GAMM|nr:hypothetical protein [Psittacicella melopsittaci]RIY31783.1 hypothetical protein CJP74_06320 [Psittacicella melopsittaci]